MERMQTPDAPDKAPADATTAAASSLGGRVALVTALERAGLDLDFGAQSDRKEDGDG